MFRWNEQISWRSQIVLLQLVAQIDQLNNCGVENFGGTRIGFYAI